MLCFLKGKMILTTNSVLLITLRGITDAIQNRITIINIETYAKINNINLHNWIRSKIIVQKNAIICTSISKRFIA